MLKVLFICTGNICRSPTAHAIARHKAKILKLENNFTFDSAATHGFHAGSPPDLRAVRTGEEVGISFDNITSRKITKDDFENFDLLMAMDRSHVKNLQQISDPKYHHKIKLFLEFCNSTNPWNNEVIDPYYQGHNSFYQVFDVIDVALENFFKMN